MELSDRGTGSHQSFALTRYFSIASMVCTIIVAALLGWSYQHLALRDLVHLAQDRNVALTYAFSNSLWPKFASLVEHSDGSGADTLRSQAKSENLYSLVANQMKDTKVIKVKIYSLEGITVFSSDPAQTGENKNNNPAFETALSGEVISGLTHRNTFDAFEGTLTNLDVISTYLPILDDQISKVAVFEIYSDVTDLTTRLAETRVIVIAAVLSLLGLLYALLYIIVFRAQKFINQQKFQLEQSILDLDKRVKMRTEALDATNHNLLKEIDERKRTEEILRASTDRYRAVTQSSNDAIVTVDSTGAIVGWNKEAEFIFGYTEEEIIGQPLVLVIPERYVDAHTRGFNRTMEGGGLRTFGNALELEGQHKNRSEFPVEMSLATWEVEGEWYVSSTIRDITEKKRAEHQLRIAAAAFETEEGVAITDANQVILRVNKAFVEITGYSAEDVVGKTPSFLSSDRHDESFYASMWEDISNTGKWQGEIWNKRKNGEIYPEWLTVTAVKGADGEVSNYVGTFDDITQRKSAENEISQLAFYDPLTDLPNRRLLLDRLKHALASSSRTNRQIALLFIDLDNFKTLNDTLGHDIGDQLLQQIALGLAGRVREGDTVARLGGDEFVVLLEDLSENSQEAATQAETKGEKILAAINRTYNISGFTHHCTASIGVTLLTDDQSTVDDLMKQADLAMYQAKDAGRNTMRFFDPEMQVALTNRSELEAGLREAIEKEQFVLYYQGQVNEEAQLTGVEALLRWLHPSRGLVPPLEFIPLAEETKLILPIGNWVLETACNQLKVWADQPSKSHLTMAVNVSARQLQQPDFVNQVLDVIDKTGANPKLLKLELTESLLVDNVEDIIAKMTELKAKGVCFSLDDFGTGYSSLSYLKRLPLDQLKIDQSFVRNILEDPNDAAIARTVITLADSLNLDVIAEGVETKEQCAFLTSQDCLAYQGFLFYKPLPINEFELLASQGSNVTETTADLVQ